MGYVENSPRVALPNPGIGEAVRIAPWHTEDEVPAGSDLCRRGPRRPRVTEIVITATWAGTGRGHVDLLPVRLFQDAQTTKRDRHRGDIGSRFISQRCSNALHQASNGDE
jgi:hypothetical protein